MKTHKIFSDGKIYEVSEEISREITHQVNRTRYRAQLRGECCAGRKSAAYCEGDCQSCRFCSLKTASLDDPDSAYRDLASDIYGGSPTSADQMSLMEWCQVLADLIPDGEIMAKLWASGYTDSAIAKRLGVSVATVHSRKRKLRNELTQIIFD